MNNKTTNNQPSNDLGFSPDALEQRQAELLALMRQTVPEVMADNQLNVDKLKELLGHDRIAPDEHYELNWAGKSAARREIQKASSLTLRPDPKNPPNAQHMLIEGENLEVLRVLQKSYYGKVKMIYIDPPYNTGNDSFVYPDDYSETLEEYQKRTGEKNEAGYLNKQSLWKKNSKESGQYHSAWLSMMYPRLYLARNLLREDGLIFISIDSNEAANLKLLCDEIFGGENYIADLIWKKKSGGGGDVDNIVIDHETILVFGKSQSAKVFNDKGAVVTTNYNKKDEDGRLYSLDRLDKQSLGYQKSLDFPITGPDGKVYEVIHKNPNSKVARWRWGKETVAERYEELVFEWPYVYTKNYEKDDGAKVRSLLVEERFGRTRTGKSDIKELFGNSIMDFPKPSKLINFLCSIASRENDLVLDFFAGSGTTAQAVLELNLEDGNNRQFICVQLPELLDRDTEAYKAGYSTIADITRARISKVIVKLKTEYPDKTQDLACSHFTLAPSNFKVWHGDVDSAEALREQLSIFQSAEMAGRDQQAVLQTAMLTEILLKHGLGALGVHAIAKPRVVAGVTVHRVLMADDKTMWLCFETYTDALKDEIVKAMPAQVVMLNSCFVGPKADEQLANLQLELAGLDIGLTVI